MDDQDRHRVLFYASKKLVAAEKNYMANDRYLLALVRVFYRFCPYREVSKFEVLIDNQVAKNFMTKKSFNLREARWLETLSSCKIRETNLVQWKIHVPRTDFPAFLIA